MSYPATNACRKRKLDDVRNDDQNYPTNHHFTMNESKTRVSNSAGEFRDPVFASWKPGT